MRRDGAINRDVTNCLTQRRRTRQDTRGGWERGQGRGKRLTPVHHRREEGDRGWDRRAAVTTTTYTNCDK